MFGVALLRKNQNLVTRRGRADEAPAVADPGGEEREPTAEDAFGLERDAGGGGLGVDGSDGAEARSAAGLVLVGTPGL